MDKTKIRGSIIVEMTEFELSLKWIDSQDGSIIKEEHLSLVGVSEKEREELMQRMTQTVEKLRKAKSSTNPPTLNNP